MLRSAQTKSMVTPIAIEIPPIDAPMQETQRLEVALLRACSVAATPDPCVKASDLETAPELVAVVSFQDGSNVHIEIASRRHAAWVERTLTFSPEDPLLERFQATGYAIG